MPRTKGKKKDKSVWKPSSRRIGDSRQLSDEEYDTGDNLSVISNASTDVQSLSGGAEGGDEIDEINAQEQLEDKLKDVIDGLTQKSMKGRVECLISLRTAFIKKYLFDFIIGRKLTIQDCLEKCLKKGKGEEQGQAAICSVLLTLQLGTAEEGEELLKHLMPLLTIVMTDTSASIKARTACAEALGLLTFLGSGELEKALEVMKSLEGIFRASYLKGDHTPPSHNPEVCSLHNAALTSWTLLLSIAPDSVVQDFIDSHLSRISELLQSTDVDLRISCGESLALMYELARYIDPDFDGDDFDQLCTILKELATDSNKFRAKKDRRQQRSSFREVLRAIEEGDRPSYRVQFGTEYITIDSWVTKRHYDSLCHILSIGMNVHLMENELVRDIFGLGSPIPVGLKPTQRPSRSERHMFNAKAFKARTKIRSKLRDKRIVSSHIGF